MPAKRCPMCHTVNRSTVATCDCGYAFGEDVPDLRNMLLHQQSVGVLWILLGAALVVIGGVGILGRLWFAGIAVGVFRIVAGGRRIVGARRSLQKLDGKDALPAARVVR
jgi:hypothetical protein